MERACGALQVRPHGLAEVVEEVAGWGWLEVSRVRCRREMVVEVLGQQSFQCLYSVCQIKESNNQSSYIFMSL